jgi:hypothetical protein
MSPRRVMHRGRVGFDSLCFLARWTAHPWGLSCDERGGPPTTGVDLTEHDSRFEGECSSQLVGSPSGKGLLLDVWGWSAPATRDSELCLTLQLPLEINFCSSSPLSLARSPPLSLSRSLARSACLRLESVSIAPFLDSELQHGLETDL